MKAAYLASYAHVNNYKEVNVTDILQDIKTERFKRLIDALPTYGTKEYSEEKRKLPAWSFAGKYNGRIANDSFLESNGLFHIDIDGLEDVEYSKQWIVDAIPELFALWVSPSGHGLKGLIRVEDEFIKNDTDYKAAFEQIFEYIFTNGFTIDKQCKDIRRLCFVCSDASIFINTAAPQFVFSREVKPTQRAITPIKPTQTSAPSQQKYINRAVNLIISASKGSYHGARLAAGKLAGGFISGGVVNESDIIAALEKASDYICSTMGDSEEIILRERKAIMDGVSVGLSMPCERDQPRQIINQEHDYCPMPDYQTASFDGTTGQQIFYSEPPPAEIKPENKFKFITANDLLSREYKPNWLVKGLFERNSMGLLFGNSASGKSLLVQDLAWCLANGFDFKGHKTADCSKVVYICGEGFYGLMKRFRALKYHYGGDADNLIISEQPAAFMDISSAVAVSDAITEWGGCDLIVIDTFHRNMGAGDENSAKDFAQFLSNVDMFLKPFAATILIIHHSGHDAKERSRGSSAIRASMDFEYRMHKDDDTGIAEFKNTKMKDFEPPLPISFKFLPVDINMTDDDGDSVSGVVLESTDGTRASNGKALNTRQLDVLNALRQSIARDGVFPNKEIMALFPDTIDNAPHSVVHVDKWRTAAYKVIDADDLSAKRVAFNRCISTLKGAGKIGFYDGFYWIV